MGIVKRVSPSLDGAAVAVGDTARERLIKIPAGEYATPVWMETEAGVIRRIDALPWQGKMNVRTLQAHSSNPSGGQYTAILQSDWAGQLGGSTDALRDLVGGTHKWGGVNRPQNGTIIAAPSGLGWPCAKVLRVQNAAAGETNNGALEVWTTALPQQAEGTARNYRYLWVHQEPNPVIDGKQHGVQDGGAGGSWSVSTQNWNMTTLVDQITAGEDLEPDEFAIQMECQTHVCHYLLGTSGGLPIRLSKGRLYMIERQHFRHSATHYRMHCKITDVLAATVVGADANFFGTNGSGTLAANPSIPFRNVAVTTGFTMGCNGNDGTNGYHFADEGCPVVVDGLEEGQFVGDYGNVVGEVPV